MSNKVKFSYEEEEKIIDFVKNYEILFNVRHQNFRDSEKKNRLWLKLAGEMDKDSEYILL